MPQRSVLVVATGPLARSGLEALIERAPALSLAGAAEPAEAAAQTERLEPDAVVLDAGDDDGEELVAELMRSRAEPVLVALAPRDAAATLLAAGVSAVLGPDARAEQIEAAVLAACAGLAVLSAAALGTLMPDSPAATEMELPVETLTPREGEVLQLLAQGLTNPRIAARLGVSEHTVKFHVTSLMGKLSARTRAEAVARAMRLGWVLV